MKHTVDHIGGEVRLRNYALNLFPQLATNNAVKTAIKKGHLRVNGATSDTGYFVQEGDEITYDQPKIEFHSTHSIDVLYEDEYLAIVRKPAGLVTSGNTRTSLAAHLPHILKPSQEEDYLSIPKPAHRLDRMTSGLLLVSKCSRASVALGKMLQEHTIDKYYAAIVVGNLNKKGMINTPIDGQEAVTEVIETHTLQTKDETSLVRVRLHTGRTHQIRKHLLGLGHPIVGDPLYNEDGLTFKQGLFLVAYKMEFQHPFINDHVRVEIDLPKKFKKYIR